MTRHFLMMIAAVICVGVISTARGRAIGDAPQNDTRASIVSKTGYEEPFVPTSAPTTGDVAELTAALEAEQNRGSEDDFSILNAYLRDHSHSPFHVAVLTNLGIQYYHYGFFGRAIDAWQRAWNEGKGVTEPHARALVDRAVGELLRMHSRLGHADDVAALLGELGERPVSGPATEAVAASREALAVMRSNPGIAYLCGPMALKNLLLAMGTDYKDVAFLDAVRSGPHGVTLDRVSQLADQAKFPHRIIVRAPGEVVPVPSIIHWKVSHFAAIVSQGGGRYHLVDPTFGRDVWVTQSAIDAESDGYFLVPASNHDDKWKLASLADIAHVRGMGYPGGTEDGATCACDTTSQPAPANPPPLAIYSFTEMVVSLHISDTPVGYSSPIGPSTKVTINYNQREAYQPANFSYFNVSQKWTLNWLSYIEDDPNSPGSSVSRYAAGGGDINYPGYVSSTGQFTPEPRDASVLSRATSGPIVYHRTLADGSVETYAQSNGATSYPRLVFLTKITDPAGNAVTLTYDTLNRLTKLTDATGRITAFAYDQPSQPLLVTRITDPFGRSAQLGYDTSARLVQITDVLGLTSRFNYDSSSLIDAMTTPYGTTRFTYGQNGTYRYLTATDPLGHTERLEWNQPAPSPIPFSEPTALIPVGVPNPFNEYINGRDTFYWDKHAYATAAGNYGAARVRHWMHLNTNTQAMYHAIESYKYPYENRVWMGYPNQSSTGFSGSIDFPSTVGRVLDDGTTQLSRITYNLLGHVTDYIDPVGRETQFTYATNGFDVVSVAQRTSSTAFSTIAEFTYNSQHRPLTSTDAAGQTTKYTYNAAGQLLTRTDALGEEMQYDYDSHGNLQQVINANSKTQVSFTYDALDRVATSTDSEGYVIAYTYDPADRLLTQTYPDGSQQKSEWANLDLKSTTDRLGNTTAYSYDAVRDLLSVTDPLSHITHFAYYENQSPKSLTDANGHTTTLSIDIQNRVTGKQYADGRKVLNTYEATTSRLRSIQDALGQVKHFTYAEDDTLAGITYTNAINPTANVTFAYDPYFKRITSMKDGIGTTTFSYRAVGANGALELASEVGPYTNNGITYGYDALGRVNSRQIDTAIDTFTYDAIGRVASHVDPLGSFALSYLGQTQQVTLSKSSVAGTQWNYDTNINDRRLTAIINPGASREFQFKSTPENLVTSTTQSISGKQQQAWSYAYDTDYRLASATPTSGSVDNYHYDPAGNITSALAETGSYNDTNQIETFGGQSYTYDANGNVLSDGTRTYKWDAENRLVSIGYIGVSNQSSSFLYDGLGRRLAITDVNSSGTVVTRYLWCGESLCQARNGSDVVTRRYYREGEVVPASGALLYYGRDQLGSVRDVFAVQTSAVGGTYDYDPYGNSIGASGSMSTDFRYAGMFLHVKSGLYLTNYRAYNPQSGRWLSRDPIQENGGINLYAYVFGNPVGYTDPNGEFAFGALIGALYGAISGATAAAAQGGCLRDILAGAFLGGAAGALIGLIDPSEGIGTFLYLGALGGGTTDALGQWAAGMGALYDGRTPEPFNWGELGGSILGGGIGTAIGGRATFKFLGAALNPSDFAPEFEWLASGSGKDLLANWLGGLAGFFPSTVGGPAGKSLSDGSSKKSNCGCGS